MGNLSLTVISGETLDNSISLSLTFPIYTMEQYELQNAPLLRELSSHSFLPGSSSPLCLTSSILGYSHAPSSLSLKVTSERTSQTRLRSHSPPRLCLMDTIFDYLMSFYHFIHLFYFIFLSVCVCWGWVGLFCLSYQTISSIHESRDFFQFLHHGFSKTVVQNRVLGTWKSQ